MGVLQKCMMVLVSIAALAVPPGWTMAVEAKADYPVKPVTFTQVSIEDAFWAPRLSTSRDVTIPACFKRCEETGRIDNFAIAGGLKEGFYRGARYNDSDLYKVVEGAAYQL
ncbi:MAG: glycoside hydrolase family 127 protein, partial [Planctomycetota bacterium]